MTGRGFYWLAALVFLALSIAYWYRGDLQQETHLDVLACLAILLAIDSKAAK